MNGGTKFRFQFLRTILLTLVVVGAAGLYPLMRYADEEVAQGIVAGVALSVVNVLMGYIAIEYSFNRSYTHFVQVVLGGIAVRLFVMTGLLLLLIGVFKFHSIALVGSLFGMYMIFLAEEVLYIHNKWQKKIQNS
ncbi:MAG: hypothetical protein HYV29_06995 [Ignavibacteriales bacterium]|nr:hypothetical protein [Ignavibacteriales bacterium]